MTEQCTSPSLSDEERLQQVAIILARGVLRLRRGAPHFMSSAREKLAKLPASGLDVSGKTVLSGDVG